MWKLKVVKSSRGLRKAKQYREWGLYDQTRENSRFYQLYHGVDPEAESASFISVELWQGTLCRGVAHFQHFDDKFFIARGGQRQVVWMMGRLGVYVDPTLRGQGLAQKLLLRLEREIARRAAKRPDCLPMVCARMGANPLCNRHFSRVLVTDSLSDIRVWRRTVNGYLRQLRQAA